MNKYLNSNIKSFFVKGYYFYILLIFIIYAALFGWKHNVIGRLTSSNVTGRVADISENTPIEMVMVYEGSKYAYSNYLGQFNLVENGTKIPQLKIEIPKNFEGNQNNLTCKKVSESLLDRSFNCEVSLYPQPFEIAYRILNGEAPVAFNMREARRIRKESIWWRSHSESRTAFGRIEDFVNLLMYKEEIEIKKKSKLLFYEVDEDYKLLPTFFDKITSKEYKLVAEVSVNRTYEGGKAVTNLEHFVRENGVWRYLLTFSYKDLKNFVDNNKWVLQTE